MRRLVLILASAALAFGQLADNTVTVQASRVIYPQPDQVAFWISATTGFDATVDDAVAALDGSGLEPGDLAGVRDSPAGKGVQWNFTLAVPLAQFHQTWAALAAVQGRSALQVAFGVNGTQISMEARAATQCSQADLVADAKVQAQKMAALAGLSVGRILAVSDGSLPAVMPTVGVPTALFRSGDFSGVPFPANLIPVFAPSQPAICSLTVRFALHP